MRNVPIDMVSELRAQTSLPVVNSPFHTLTISRKIFHYLSLVSNDSKETSMLHHDLTGYELTHPTGFNEQESSGFNRPEFELIFSNVELKPVVESHIQLLRQVRQNSPTEYRNLVPLLDKLDVQSIRLSNDIDIDGLVERITLIDAPTILLLDIAGCESKNVIHNASFAIQNNSNIFTIFTSQYDLSHPEFDYISLNTVDLLPLVFVDQLEIKEAS